MKQGFFAPYFAVMLRRILGGILLVGSLAMLGACATGMTTQSNDVTTPSSTLTDSTEQSEVDVDTLMARADLAYQQGDLKKAEQAYRLVIQHSINNAPAQYRLGNTLARQNRFDEAIKAYQASLQQDASKMQTYNNLATVYMLQAQAILSSGVDRLPPDLGTTAQIKHMLWQLKRITPERIEDIQAKLN